MKTVIIGNGQISNYSRLKEYIKISDFIICCDGGIVHAYNINIIPNCILGDLDSAPKNLIEYYKNKNVIFHKFPVKKDKTDMEIGLDFAIEMNCSEIFIFGGTGTRFDHTLANAHILIKALKKGIKAKLIDENNIIFAINNNTTIENKKGCFVSLIPLTTEVSGITALGFEYSLKNASLKIGSSLGISNVIIDDKAHISLSNGILFVIISND